MSQGEVLVGGMSRCQQDLSSSPVSFFSLAFFSSFSFFASCLEIFSTRKPSRFQGAQALCQGRVWPDRKQVHKGATEIQVGVGRDGWVSRHPWPDDSEKQDLGQGEHQGRKKVPGKGIVDLVPARDTAQDLLRTHRQRTLALKQNNRDPCSQGEFH